MINMRYTVSIEPTVGYTIKEQTVSTESEAIEIANTWAAEIGTDSENAVYISFFRKSDGQTGYINPDGAGISGKNWANPGN
jgi:uncharacterized membrane protein